VAAREPVGVIPAKPDAPVLVLPGQRLERQVDTSLLGVKHERSAARGMAENQQFRRPQIQARLTGSLRVVDPREHQQTRLHRPGGETVDRLRNGEPALHRDQTLAHRLPLSLACPAHDASRAPALTRTGCDVVNPIGPAADRPWRVVEREQQAPAGVHQPADPGRAVLGGQVQVEHARAEPGILDVEAGHHARDEAVGVGQPEQVGEYVADCGEVVVLGWVAENALRAGVAQYPGGDGVPFGVIAVEQPRWPTRAASRRVSSPD
jgi:hypothetical protein